MAFNEVRLDQAISFGATGGPMWETAVAETDSGYEYVNQVWSQPRHRYEISYDARRPEIFDRLLDFYMNMAGRFGQFRYKDWSDFSATVSQGVLGIIDATHSQLYKRYTYGSMQFNRKIVKPVSAVTLVGGTSTSVDYTTGIVTHSTAPTAWYGDFDVPVRFDTDVMQAVAINRSIARGLIRGWQSIQLVEVRL